MYDEALEGLQSSTEKTKSLLKQTISPNSPAAQKITKSREEEEEAKANFEEVEMDSLLLMKEKFEEHNLFLLERHSFTFIISILF